MDETKETKETDWKVGITPNYGGVEVQCMGCGAFVDGTMAHYQPKGPSFVFYHADCKPTEKK